VQLKKPKEGKKIDEWYSSVKLPKKEEEESR
jgi:hypothetical protein